MIPFMHTHTRFFWLIVAGIVLCIALIVTGFLSYGITHATPQPQGINCGSLSMHGGGGPSWTQHGTVAQIGNCFWNKYQQCKPATLAVTDMGVDTGVNHLFVIEPQQQGCSVSDTSQNYSANGGGWRGSPTTAVCSTVTRQQDVLRFSCGTNEMAFSIANTNK